MRPSGTDAHVRQNVAAKSLDQRRALDARLGCAEQRCAHGSCARERCERRLSQPMLRWIFENPHPHARIDVALVTHDHLDGSDVVRGRTGAQSARIERAPGSAADVAGRGELALRAPQ